MIATITDYAALAALVLILAGTFVASGWLRRRQQRRMRESWRAQFRAKYRGDY